MKTMRVRPVLVETSEKSRICHLSPKGIQYKDLRFLEIECSIILDSINYDIVLISLDNRYFKKGDNVYSEVLDEIFELTNCELIDNLNNGVESGIYKVIANQRQFSDELTEKLVEEYNNGGMNDFIIEMNVVTMCQSLLKYDNDDILVNGEIVGSFDYSLTDIIDKTIEEYNKPKLTNGYITPVQNKEIQKPLNDYINQRHNQDRCIGFIDGYETRQFETKENEENKENKEGIIIRNIPYPIIYTEEDVRILFKNWIKLKSDEVGLDNLSFDEWFEIVKK